MNNFNFSLNDSQVSASSSNYFKPYTINEINSVKAEYATQRKTEIKEEITEIKIMMTITK